MRSGLTAFFLECIFFFQESKAKDVILKSQIEKRFEQGELPGKILGYILWSNKSLIE